MYLANSPEMEGFTGGYYANSRKGSSSDRAVNSELAYSLWAKSEELTGTRDILESLQLSAWTASM